MYSVFFVASCGTAAAQETSVYQLHRPGGVCGHIEKLRPKCNRLVEASQAGFLSESHRNGNSELQRANPMEGGTHPTLRATWGSHARCLRSEKDLHGSRVQRERALGTVERYPRETAARSAIAVLLERSEEHTSELQS